MLSSDYITKRDEIIKQFSEDINIWEDDFTTGKFNLVSAGLHNYLPQIPYEEHEPIFKKILMHQRLSLLEQSYQEVLKYLTCEGLSEEKSSLLKSGGCIICTFHTGSYRIVNHILTKNEMPFTLVVAKSVLESQGAEIAKLHRLFTGAAGEAAVGMIDAESASAGLQMLKELKKGKNLVLYIDGNAGSGDDQSEKNNLCSVQFLAQSVFARKGIAFLAHIAKVPILPVVGYRKGSDDIRLKFFSPIYPDLNESRESFSQIATQKIYDCAAPIIEAYPEQWEAWSYLHKSVHITHPKPIKNALPTPVKIIMPNDLLMFNSREYGVFKIQEDSYLFRKADYTSFPIEDQLFTKLQDANKSAIRCKEIDADLFYELYENEVLIPCQ